MYLNVNQQLAHHTINGCNIQVGDMYASGTISGSTQDSYGSLLELTCNGKQPLKLTNGSERTFIEDGDSIVMRGFALKENIRIGFGECRGKCMPAL
jgi:fumarylacetoacetase